MNQPACGHPAHRIEEDHTFRRNGQSVSYRRVLWSCPVCTTPETGQSPYVYIDGPLSRENEQRIQQAWLDAYQTPLPLQTQRKAS